MSGKKKTEEEIDDALSEKDTKVKSTTKKTVKEKTADKVIKTDEDIPVKVNNTKSSSNKPGGMYFGFGIRLFFNIILFLIFLCGGTLLLLKSLNFEDSEVINYTENSDIDYNVYLFENDFYDEPYLNKKDVNLFVANLIDKINLDFKYMFESDEKETLDFKYSIVGKLSITNKSGTKAYYNKTYTLLESKTVTMENKDYQIINEKLDIDYVYYNSLANRFKNSYGVDTESTFTVYLLMTKVDESNTSYVNDGNNTMSIIIPLSEKAVDISLDYQSIHEASTIVKNKDVSVGNIVLFALAILFILLSLVMVVKIIRKISIFHVKKTPYDKYVGKILKDYDRLIAETNTLISFEGKQVIEISKFNELLDIHDNLQLPIMHYVVHPHQKCYFYISHEDVIYLLTIKNIELEKKGNKVDKR